MRHGNLLMWVIGLSLMLFLLSACSPTTRIMCPSLAPPPESVIASLETAGRKDPNAAAWVGQLDKHYQKLDVCR